jgi:membrane protein implicated in regulation of membrane protease activity
VWRSYLVEDKNKSKPMLGSKGIAVNDLSPTGQVRINGELWQAELYYPDETIFQGQCIEVKDIYGLKLKVSQYGLKDSNNNKRKE